MNSRAPKLLAPRLRRRKSWVRTITASEISFVLQWTPDDLMAAPSSTAITRLLQQWTAGDPRALERLLPLVYDELRRIARCHLGGERPGRTLETTALVNEAYIRLVDSA